MKENATGIVGQGMAQGVNFDAPTRARMDKIVERDRRRIAAQGNRTALLELADEYEAAGLIGTAAEIRREAK